MPDRATQTAARAIYFVGSAAVHPNHAITNLHAFGYFATDVSVMKRTANESVLVLEQMTSLLAQ